MAKRKSKVPLQVLQGQSPAHPSFRELNSWRRELRRATFTPTEQTLDDQWLDTFPAVDDLFAEEEQQVKPLRSAESIPPNDVSAPIEPSPDDCAERPECALSFADLAHLREEAGELPSAAPQVSAKNRRRGYKIQPPETKITL